METNKFDKLFFDHLILSMRRNTSGARGFDVIIDLQLTSNLVL